MKNLELVLFILFLMLFISCDNDNQDEVPLTLTDNIELYDADFISDDYIFVVENSII
mgnify:FL=1